jgi:hypothetical protein
MLLVLVVCLVAVFLLRWSDPVRRGSGAPASSAVASASGTALATPPLVASSTATTPPLVDAALATDPLARLDRAERDAIRRRIYEAFGTTPPAASGAPRMPSPAEREELDRKFIEERIHSDFVPLARDCYRRGKEKNPALEGKLVMTLHVVGDEKVGGIVESTELDEDSTLDDPQVLDCLQNSMASIAMPPPQHGGTTTIKVPMRFAATPPDGSAPR